MAKIESYQTDKFLVRTLFNNFGTLLVFVFYSENSEESLAFKANLETVIPIFGDFDNVKYYFISAEKCPETLKKFEVVSTPTVILTQTDKKILKRLQTIDSGVILDSISEVAQNHRSNFQIQKALWHPKIKSILNESQVIIFIKGTPQNPKCGFTQTLLQMLKQQQVSYSYYDIISDQYMRYWLRNYCGWPTYPQIHSRGKIIGGLDVCKDLIAKGQFAAKLPKNCRVANVEQRLSLLLEEYPLLILSQEFSCLSQTTRKIISKASETHPQQEITVFNAGLDAKLFETIKQRFSKPLPLLFEKGQLKEL